MSSKNQVTTIQISTGTREDLRSFGKKGETYDDIVRKLMLSARKSAFFEEMDAIMDDGDFTPLRDLYPRKGK